jgi:hypothetical protein
MREMKRTTTPPGDDFDIRCPRLGQQISFSYCRRENKGVPCFKVLDCWHVHFLVEDLLRKELAPEEWRQAFETPPKPKMVSLVEMIERAKKRTEKGS